MRYLLVFLLLSFGTIGCRHSDEDNTPPTELQQILAGKWQVDSSVLIYNAGNSIASKTDSVFLNHFVTISNKGSKLTISMSSADLTTYSMKDSSLYPIVINSGGGCGVPVFVTTISLSNNNNSLKLNIQQQRILYLHR